jgi:hypothetical protein
MQDRKQTNIKDLTSKTQIIIDQLLILDLIKSSNQGIMNDFSYYRRLCNQSNMELPQIENNAWFMCRQLFQISLWCKDRIIKILQNQMNGTVVYDLLCRLNDQLHDDNSNNDQDLRTYLFVLCVFDGMTDFITAKQTLNIVKQVSNVFKREKETRNVDEENIRNKVFRLPVLDDLKLNVRFYIERMAPNLFLQLKEEHVCVIL